MSTIEKNADKSTTQRHNKIRSIEISGGFLDGTKLEFVEGLNCIIGGRGTGKTTVLEFLRYALNALPDSVQAPNQYKQITKLVEGNLGTGNLRVTVETKEGLQYVIQKEKDTAGEFDIFDEQEEIAEVSPENAIDINVYSQNEIEEIANTPHFQLNLIDKFVKREISDSQNELRSVRRDLGHNSSELIKLKGEILDLSQGQSEVKLLEAKLKKLLPTAGAATKELQPEITKKAFRDKEKRFITQLPNYLGGIATELDNILAPFGIKADTVSRYFSSELATGENAALFIELQKKFSVCADEVKKSLNLSSTALKKMQTAANEAIPILEKAHQTQDQNYQALLKKHETEKGQAQEQTLLQRRLNELTEKAREIKEKKVVLTAKVDQRKKLLEKLSELRDTRWKYRQQVAKTLTEQLKPEIRVEVEACGDRTPYMELLKECLKGTGAWYTALAEKIASIISPSDFTDLVQNNNVEGLITRLEINGDKANWLVSKLRDTDRIYEIQIVDVEDKPSIQLLDGDYKDASALSIGQKCTTILPILLLGSPNPLLVDQPEDNLDNNFIYEAVVKRIIAAKKERQMIFVTHNPNIPVLGGATRVFVLKSDGRKSSVAASGTVDEVRTDIEKFLEGGREAFTKRKEIYGIK